MTYIQNFMQISQGVSSDRKLVDSSGSSNNKSTLMKLKMAY